MHFDAGTGTFSGVAPLNYNGSFDVKVTATDGLNDVSDTFNIAVTPVNDTPTPHNDVFFVDEDHTLSGVNILANDTDVDGDTLHPTAATVTSGPTGSGLLYSNGDLVYTPHANASGITTIQYTVSDGSGAANATASATITVNIRPVADTATISGSGLGAEDAAANIALNIALGDTDGSEKVTRVELSGFPAGATFSQGALEGAVWVITDAAGVNTSGLTMTPPHDFAGNFDLNVAATVLDSATLTDGLHTDTLVSTGSIGVAITAVNDAPVITSGTTGGEAENTAISNVAYQAVASDVDGTLPAYTLSGADAALFDISSTGAVTFKTSPNFEAPADADHDNVYNIIVNASDGVAPAATQSVTITVTDVNEAPTITSAATATQAENTAASTVVYQIAASDPEGTALSYTLSGTDAGLFNISSTGAVTFKNAPDFEAPADAGGDDVYNIIVNVSDGVNSAVAQDVAITVTDVVEVINAAPVTGADTVITNVGNNGTVYIPEWALLNNDTDADGNSLDVANVGNALGGAQTHTPGTGSAGQVSFNDNAGGLGGSFTYRADDGIIQGNSVTVTISNTGAGNTYLTGGAGGEIIIGNSGDEIITGNAGRDVLIGNGGNDWFFVNSGDFVAGEVIDGGSGSDEIYASMGNGTSLDLTVGTVRDVESVAFAALNYDQTLTLTATQWGICPKSTWVTEPTPSMFRFAVRWTLPMTARPRSITTRRATCSALPVMML